MQTQTLYGAVNLKDAHPLVVPTFTLAAYQRTVRRHVVEHSVAGTRTYVTEAQVRERWPLLRKEGWRVVKVTLSWKLSWEK